MHSVASTSGVCTCGGTAISPGVICKLCDAEFTAVARYEDNGLLGLVATSNLSSEEAAAFHSLFPRQPTRGFIIGRAFLAGQPISVADVLADPDYDERTREVLQTLTKYRSFLGVPIIREERAIGQGRLSRGSFWRACRSGWRGDGSP
jgi:GAF domain-containing protein